MMSKGRLDVEIHVNPFCPLGSQPTRPSDTTRGTYTEASKTEYTQAGQSCGRIDAWKYP